MKRMFALVGTIAGVLLVATILTSGGAGAAATATKAPSTTDITFKEGFCSSAGGHCKTIRVGKDPRGFGSRLIFTIPFYSAGTRIGYEQGDCVYLQKRSELYFCSYNLSFGTGSVSVQGSLSASGHVGTIPITGGTGGFEGAYGYLHELKGYPAFYRLHILTP